jgi:hypothetical protein
MMSTSYVVYGATMKCTHGSQEAELKVPIDHKVDINDKRQANIKDHRPFANVPSFGLCSNLANPEVKAATARNKGRLKKRPCKPATTTPWINAKNDVLLGDEPALLSNSILRCRWKGTISITDDGQ